MSPTTLDAPAVQAFLATKEVVVLAVVKPGGGPLAMPMWFVHDPVSLAMISVDGLAKVQTLRRDGRVCVVADAGTRADDIRGVIVHGRAEFLLDGAHRRSLVDRFHAKYDPDLAQRWGGHAMPPNRVLFQIVPTQVLSWGLAAQTIRGDPLQPQGH